MSEFKYRIAKRDSFCRVCDKVNKRDEDMVVYVYSHRNRGQSILLCKKCVKDMYNTVIASEIYDEGA